MLNETKRDASAPLRVGPETHVQVELVDELDDLVTTADFISLHTPLTAETRNILNAGDAEKLRGLLARSKAGWILMEISEDVRARASRLFPVEPIRTPDAIHLATALIFMRVFPSLEVFSHDQRILKNAKVLGISAMIDA